MKVTKLPGENGNAFSSSKRLYHAIKIAEDLILEKGGNLFEAVDWEVADDEKGGMIIFSRTVNAIDQSNNKLINWVKKNIETLKNKFNSNKKIDKVSKDNNLVGWTVGHFLDGRYTAKNGQSYGEDSLSVEIVGVDSDTLVKVATELCREFKQEAVLVKDYNTGKILFVNGD